MARHDELDFLRGRQGPIQTVVPQRVPRMRLAIQQRVQDEFESILLVRKRNIPHIIEKTAELCGATEHIAAHPAASCPRSARRQAGGRQCLSTPGAYSTSLRAYCARPHTLFFLHQAIRPRFRERVRELLGEQVLELLLSCTRCFSPQEFEIYEQCPEYLLRNRPAGGHKTLFTHRRAARKEIRCPQTESSTTTYVQHAR